MNFNDINPNEYNKETFGKCIRERREELDLSLRNVAGQCGISPAYLSDIEKGNRKAPTTCKTTDVMKALINILMISKEEINSYYDMAYASRGYYEDLKNYINNNKSVRIALSIAKELDIPNEKWYEFINQIVEEQSVKKTKKN